MSTITSLPTAISPNSKGIIDTNFSNLNTDKAELSGATFTGDISVPDEAYWAGWNGSLEVPTKNAIYDKIETMWGGWATTFTWLTDTPSSYTGQALKVVQVNSWETALQFVPLSGGWDALTANPLSQFAATTSVQLAGVMSDETGSGALVFATSPTLVTPLLGTPTSGTLTNCTGLPVSGITASTSTALWVGSIELWHASDTTLSRSSAWTLAVEGIRVRTTTPLVVSAASYTTDTGTSLNMDNLDIFVITAQAWALLFNAPWGTLVQGRQLIIRIKDNGTARALTWNAVFRAMWTSLPSTTILSKTLYLGFIYNSTDSKFDLIASAQEA